MPERFPFGFAPNMNDNILYHALATRSILRLFGLPPRSALPDPHPPFSLVNSVAPRIAPALSRRTEAPCG